jgi:hypothetical protein
MVSVPSVGEGAWSQFPKLGTFALGFTAVFLGLVAIRGGFWSFRKERYGVVKVGAIAATVCVWALWIPWLFGLLALLIVTRARDEYYPFYDPRWDAPSWARPPPEPEEEEEAEEEEEKGVTEGTGWEEPAPGEGGDALST